MNWTQRMRKTDIIWNKLQDDESRFIFEQKINFIMEPDEVDLWNHIKRNQVWVCPNKEKEFIIFGAGRCGSYTADILATTGKQVIAFCDNYKDGTVQGKPVFSVDTAVKMKKPVVIPNCGYASEAQKQLKEYGFPDDMILFEPDIRSYTGIQYFDVWSPKENEILVDCGAYNGDTIDAFLKWTNYSYEKIYAFEPDDMNYRALEAGIEDKKIQSCEIINKGTWDKNTNLKFQLYDYDTGHHIVENQNSACGEERIVTVPVTSIDEILEGKEATFIKMDVEGSELNSLKGARKTIVRYKPRLAIAVYHKREDLFDIPLYILSLNSGYQFKLRHYSSGLCETVLYAE